MARCLIMRNSETNYCVFAIDSASDLSLLPTAIATGQGTEGELPKCSQCSIARGSDGTDYILDGTNTWVEYRKTVNTEIDAISDTFINSLP